MTIINIYQVYYYTLSDYCTTSMTAEGKLLSPNYPFYYGKDHECLWTIVAENDSFAALNISSLKLAPAVEDILVSTTRDNYTRRL